MVFPSAADDHIILHPCLQPSRIVLASTADRSTTQKNKRTVNLVKEDDTWLRRPRFFKEHAQLPFRLADPLGQDVGAFAHKEG